MNNSLVSIIVPVYNQAKYLPETLESVLSQSYKNWECIIINDGSKDDSERVSLDYCKKDDRFSYFYQENQGVIAARNNAIKRSSGKYILPLDGDDIISSEYLKKGVAIFEKKSDIQIVYCKTQLFGAQTGSADLLEYSKRNILRRGCFVSSSMFRKEMFDIVGGYKEEMRDGWEDWEFFISIIEKGGLVYKIDEVLFYYRISSNSRERSITEEKKKELRCKIVTLHPELYYTEYDKLLGDYNAIITSRSYKLVHFISRFLRWFRLT